MFTCYSKCFALFLPRTVSPPFNSKEHVNIDIFYLYRDFESNPTYCSWSLAKTTCFSSENHELYLYLFQYDLDLISTFSYHWCQPSHQFWYRSDQWYMIYWQKSVCITDGLTGLTGWRTDKQTDGPPNQLINQWTNETFYRGASQSLGASKKLILLFLGYNRLMVSVYYHRNDTFTFDFNWYGPSSVFWRRRMSIRLR